MKSYLDARIAGTTQKYLSLKTLRSIDVVIPKPQLLDFFSDKVSNYFNKIQFNIEQNQTLTELRDTLLPKLLSGEVTINDSEEEINKATQ